MSKYIAYLFPAIMILLNLSQGVVCAVRRDWWSVVYWLAAAALNASVGFRG